MKTLLLALSLVISFLASAQDKNIISIGKVDSIQSKVLGENRKVWVHVPGGGLNATTRYPVVYLLDGDAHFASVVGLIQQLSSVNGNNFCPEMIIVAIPNTDRRRDLTPTHVDSDPPFMDSTSTKSTGGGNNFLSFIEKELIPHIDSLYPTQPYKMLIGHSFGGLTVMNSLINRPKLFNSYICIDPSMWYDHMNFLKTTKKALSTQKYTGTTLYLGIANTMSEGVTLARLPKDTTAMNGHIRSIFELDNHAKATPQNGLRYKSKYYPDDTHSYAPLITEYDALRFIFDYYPLKLTNKDFEDSTTALADKYLKHYASVSKQMGYKVAPPENAMNAMGYQALGAKHFQKAESFFKLNISNYPESGNVYDSYGDYFVAKKDNANAIAQFEKALSVAENADTRKKLEELRKVSEK
jgi:predicted alpha/beta superfamily hydrolase